MDFSNISPLLLLLTLSLLSFKAWRYKIQEQFFYIAMAWSAVAVLSVCGIIIGLSVAHFMMATVSAGLALGSYFIAMTFRDRDFQK